MRISVREWVMGGGKDRTLRKSGVMNAVVLRGSLSSHDSVDSVGYDLFAVFHCSSEQKNTRASPRSARASVLDRGGLELGKSTVSM